MVTLLQALPGIKITHGLVTQEKKKQFWFAVMLINMTVGRTDVKLKVTRRQRMKRQLFYLYSVSTMLIYVK